MRRWGHPHTGLVAFLAGGAAFTGHGWALFLVGALVGALVVLTLRLMRNTVRRTSALATAATARLEQPGNADALLPAGWAPCAQCGIPHYRRSPFCSQECRRYFRLAAAADETDDD